MVDGRCRAGAARHPFKPSLAATKRTLTETNRLSIVALGSSSTAGTGASDPDRSYPAVLEAELRRRLPGREIKVLNLGVGGQSAYEMYLRLDNEVIPEKPSLVIWQTAVNDAVAFQLSQPRTQRLRRDPLQVGLQLGKPPGLLPKVPEHVRRPGAPEDTHARRQRADGWWEYDSCFATRHHDALHVTER